MSEDTSAEPTQEQSVEAERPEWLPENFETPEALAQSYKEAQRKLSEMGQDKNNLEAQLEDLYGRMQTLETQRQQPPQQGYDPNSDPFLLAYEQAMENGDYRNALAIQMGLMQASQQKQPVQEQPQQDFEAWAFIAEQTAASIVGDQNEWSQYRDRVRAEANNENFEGLSAQKAGEKLARIYKMFKAEDVLNNQQTAAEQRAEADRQAKLAAQSMSGASGRPQEPTQDEKTVSRILAAAQQGSYDGLTRG